MTEKWSRILALFLVVLFLAGLTLPAQAAGTFADLQGHWVEAKVNDLVTAGIISPGEKYRPRDPVTRADFVKMLVLASGLPQAVSYPPTFSDVRQDHWFHKYVETAAYHGVVKGDATGRFRPFEGLTREQMASMVIRALKDEADAGLSFLARFKDGAQTSKWAEADLARAVARGIISGTDQGFLFPTQAATRDQAAAVIWQVWKQLGTGGQAGTPTIPAGTLSAVAKAPGLNSVLITFNQLVDTGSAAQAVRYRLVPATGLQVEVPVEAVQVATDGRSVTLSTGLLAKGTRYLLSILDLTAGGKTHTLSLYFVAGDASGGTEAPIVGGDKNVIALGPTRLKITFDQELDPESVSAGPGGNFTLVYAGTAFSPGLVTEAVMAGPREVILTVPELKVGERYTISIHDLRDVSGNKLPADPVSFSFTVSAGQQAPRLTSLICTGPESLELTFDQELDKKSAGSVNSYRIRETGERPQHVWVTGRTAVLVFTGQFTAGTGYTLDVEPLADLWGNLSTATSRSVTVGRDTAPPKVLSAKALSATTVEVLFNEKLISIGDITLTRKGRRVDVRRAEQVSPGRVVISTSLDRADRYRLEFAGAMDINGNKATAGSLYFTFAGDIQSEGTEFPPEVKQVKPAPGRSDQILVQYSQPVRALSAERIRNYRLTLAEDLSTAVEIESAEMGSDGKEVLLTLEEPLKVGQTYRYFVSGVESVSGGELIPAAGYLVPGSSSQEGGFVRSVTAVDDRQVEVVFNEDVQDKYAASNYGLVDQETGRLVPVLGVDATSDSFRVILRLGQDLQEDCNYLFSAGNKLADTTGKLFSTFNTTVRFSLDSTIGLRLSESRALDSRSFRLVFNRPVQEVRVDLSGYVFQYEYYGSVVLVRANKSFRDGQSYRPEVWARDSLGQVLDWRTVRLEFDTYALAAELVDVAAATSQRIKAEFSGPLDSYSAGDEANYYIETGSQAILRPVKAEYDPARLLVWLTLPTASSLGEERYWLVLDGVKDASGNKLAAGERYRFYGVDTVPPVVLLPYVINQEGLPVCLLSDGSQVTLEGTSGAVEAEAYLRVYLDDRLVAVGQAAKDGSFKALRLGQPQGRCTLRLVVTDLAGNSGERSQVFQF